MMDASAGTSLIPEEFLLTDTSRKPPPLTIDFQEARSQNGIVLLPGELPRAEWPPSASEHAGLIVDPALMTALATKAMAAGDGLATAVGVASVQHGEGATSIARSLAVCLATMFGKRVVLVEANQRSPSLRRLFGLPEGPGLADVVARRASLGGALQITRAHRGVLVLPASSPQTGERSSLPLDAGRLREVVKALMAHADAVILDLPPVIPYRDTPALCPALDGMALVMRGGHSTIADSRRAVAAIRDAGTPMLGGVLNRERAILPRFMERLGARFASR